MRTGFAAITGKGTGSLSIPSSCGEGSIDLPPANRVFIHGGRMTVSRCFRCGLKTSVPFEDREPCPCGSVAWFQGQRSEWPPMEAPAFLAGTIPGGDVLSFTNLIKPMNLLTATAQRN